MSARRSARGRGSARRPGAVRRRIAAVVVVAAVIAVGVYVPASLLAPIAPASAEVTKYTAPTEKALSLRFPDYGATAVEAVGFDDSLTTSGDSKPRSIASISKIVTALVVLSKKPLDGGSGPDITFTASDRALYDTYLAQDGEVAAMPAGLTLTEKQTLQVALIKSANNYASALAYWAFGSNQAYVTAAKAWLKEHGLNHTTLVEPTGLNAANRSTATDLVKLGKLALANPDIASIVSTKSVDIPVVGTVENSNKLLGIDDVVGIKTGTLDEAGACLLFATREEVLGHTVTVVGVMLGGVDHDSLDVDVAKLLTSVKSGFQTVTAVTADDVYGSYDTEWGSNAHAVAAKTVSKLVYGSATVKAVPALDTVGEATAGSKVGTLRVTIGSSVTTVPLVLDRAMTEPDAWWRLTNPSSVF
ncbi:D-alanyl-D-alanine carboxypeptidase (penicillin-binding protein 5/6) [Frondihabitans sp. PhB188]|uniref:D-alanyl-D-alanine carboxypeptidase family protein n=1 Tax=Frondihabitans sp. PhB188 TaxID=2485200 RepID=UPI000FA2F2F1|nr:D-alanyl-D-alanine carboxypeptidase [Frondihabitans sp. PhB188]ROQ40933.1 D-alanyl-D-alanine carboxypeptidase (penicillin-binding protein 5/6) [Frondihabitans sp. PhB188]